MPTWIALFRGINVGGKNSLPMNDLKCELAALGSTNVRTYIQSGNVVFESRERGTKKLADSISDRIESAKGFRPHVMLLNVDAWRKAVEQNPFPQADSEPTTVHLFFLATVPRSANETKIATAKASREQYQQIDRVFYLYAPDGIGRSKLASSVERHLGVATTARNWRTVSKITTMLSD